MASTKHLDRVFNAAQAQLNELAAKSDPAALDGPARDPAREEEDRLRRATESMTVHDVIPRILLHHKERNYFRLLELPAPEADALGRMRWEGTPATVSRAYRRLSILVHPDKNPGEDARKAFEALNEAHRVLKDPNKLDTLLKEHQEAALARREQKDAGATLEERVALNAAQKAEVAELRKQEGASFQAEIVRQLKERQARAALKRQRESQIRRRTDDDDEPGLESDAREQPAPQSSHAEGVYGPRKAAAGSDDEEDSEAERRRRRAALSQRRKRPSLF